jgi:hypothetical protein
MDRASFVSASAGDGGGARGGASSVRSLGFLVMSSQSAAPRALYLDTNVWVDITRGCSRSDSAWLEIRDRLAQAVDADKLVLPLSPAHYLELWHRRDSASRRQVALMMRDLTRYKVIPSAHVVRQLEARALVRSWVDPTAKMPKVSELIGNGAAHAFGRPDGRFRFVESIASADGETPEGQPADPPNGWEQARQHPDWEWLQLFGTEELVNAERDFDRTPEHRFGSAQLSHELSVRDWLRSHPEARSQFRDIVIAEEFETMRDYIEGACRVMRVQPPEALRKGGWGPTSASAIQALVRAAPSSDCWATLRFMKHRDLNMPWEQHDWTDLWSLSVAIPYCDAVVTEKRWAHLASAGGLTKRYETTVGHGKQAMLRELERAG